MKHSPALWLPALSLLLLTGGCEWMDSYPAISHTTPADEQKTGPGQYGGTNTPDLSSHPPSLSSQNSTPSDSPGSGTSNAAGSDVRNNSMSNFTGNSSETTGVGSVGTSTYSGSNVGGSTAGQTNNNGTNGAVSIGTK